MGKEKKVNIPELNDKRNFLGKWSSFFIERHRIVFLIVLIILIMGIGAYSQLPREVNPEVVIPYGIVTTRYNGASPKEVESLVTDIIEEALDEINEDMDIESQSTYGMSIVTAEFDTSVDMDEMLNKMRTKISEVSNELPDEAMTPMVSDISTSNSPIMIMNISGEYSLSELKYHAKSIEKELKKISKVSDIDIIGGVDREINIQVDPLKLSTYNLKLSQIEQAIKGSNIDYPGGDLELDKRSYNIRTVGKYKTVEELKKVVISNTKNTPLLLEDVAKIIDGYEAVDSYSRLSENIHSDNPSMKNSIALSIKKKEGGDITKVSKLIKEKIKEGGFYPDDLNVTISGDMSEYVEDQLGTVINNSKAGLFLVIIVLYLFIGFRESLIVSFVIPLSILIALALMQLNDISFNTISLFALILAIGMLVDNGIVIMENVDRLRLLGLESKIAAEVGTNQIAPAIMASTLTTVAAFFPIALTPGVMGEYIRQIPLTVIFTLVASFFVAVTITPTLSAYLLKNRPKIKKIQEKEKAWMHYIPVIFVALLALYAFRDEDTGIGLLSIIFAVIFAGAMILKTKFSNRDHKEDKEHYIIEKYGEILKNIISSKKKRFLVLAAAFLVFISSLSLIPLGILKVEMFTEEDYDRLYINIETPKGSVLEDTKAITEVIEKELFKIDAIDVFVSNIGKTGADSFDDFSFGNDAFPNQAQIIIDLKDQKDRSITSMELADELREFTKTVPGAKVEVQELQGGPPQVSPVNILIKGQNLDDLEKVSMDFKKILMDIKGTRLVETSVEEGYPELQIFVDQEKASNYGLTEYEVAKQIRENIYGIEVTEFQKDQEEIDINIKLSDDEFNSIDDINKIQLMNSYGQSVNFSDVASLKETTGYTSITHDALTREVSVRSELEGKITSREVLKDFEDKISEYDLPDDVSYYFGGESEEINENYTQMFLNMIIAAVLVFLILAIQFNSLSQPFIILLTVPLALIGVMYGLVITGNKFTFVAFVGVVALVGIAVNDAIVLVDYINYLRKNDYSLKEAICKTGKTRFLPVMATTITTAGGILPITLKQPFFSPLGYSIIFGLCTATVLTLLIIPIMYSLLEGAKFKFKRKKA